MYIYWFWKITRNYNINTSHLRMSSSSKITSQFERVLSPPSRRMCANLVARHLSLIFPFTVFQHLLSSSVGPTGNFVNSRTENERRNKLACDLKRRKIFVWNFYISVEGVTSWISGQMRVSAILYVVEESHSLETYGFLRGFHTCTYN